MKKILFLLLAFNFTLIGCSSDDAGGNYGYTTTAMTEIDCTGTSAFNPVTAGLADPVVTNASGTPKNTTIILLHGKTGVPNASHLTSFQSDIAALGYKVVAPYTTWSTTTWNGSLCEGMAYINDLAQAEIDAGQSVVLAGHSMGGAYSLMYGVTQPSKNIKAIVTMAPGHFVHISNLLQTTTQADVNRAKSLEANNNGDTLDTFVTLNNGSEQNITTTATRYLSFHDLDRVPNIQKYASKITAPVLWISGSNDSLTITQDHAGLANLITSTGSTYQLITADHKGVVALTPGNIDSWLNGL